MSYLTDKLRADAAAARGDAEITHVPGQMLDEVLSKVPMKRRSMLRGSLGVSLTAIFGASALSACGGGGDDTPSASVPSASENYAVDFQKVDATVGQKVSVPANYTSELLYTAGDALLVAGLSYQGTALSLTQLEQVSGGQHDGMEFYAIPGRDPNKNGLLAINHENTDNFMLNLDERLTAIEKTQAQLSNVGVDIVEIKLNETSNKWEVVVGSQYNKRHTGNTNYAVSGPAAGSVGEVDGVVVGTLNNCASGSTPWGTYLTCEETTSNYWYTRNGLTPPADAGYGWVVEIDPLNEIPALATPVKHTAMGRFSHENTAYLLNANNRVAFYMGDDTTPGSIYKFVPNGSYNPSNRAANATLLTQGKLYAAKFNADGTGQWLELTQGLNGLVVGATDPGRSDRTTDTPVTIDFVTQADVLINCKAAARVAGATQMDRPEWITVGLDNKVYCTLTNNSSRTVPNDANPRTNNPYGHIIEWTETNNDVTATTFNWEFFLLAGSQKLSAENLKGDINGDEFSSPDGLRIDPQGRLWVQTDASTSSTTTSIFGNNAMYHVDLSTKRSTRFLVGPDGCEITGLAYTPDLKTFFINIQHPGTGWPVAGQAGRSSTIVVRHNEGKPVGA
jgi:secreted PhoX family phosphatase